MRKIIKNIKDLLDWLDKLIQKGEPQPSNQEKSIYDIL